jgi:hypothetical protein
LPRKEGLRARAARVVAGKSAGYTANTSAPSGRARTEAVSAPNAKNGGSLAFAAVTTRARAAASRSIATTTLSAVAFE